MSSCEWGNPIVLSSITEVNGEEKMIWKMNGRERSLILLIGLLIDLFQLVKEMCIIIVP